MTAAEVRLSLRIQRRAASLEPDLAARLLQAWRTLRASLSVRELEQLIANGSLESLFVGPLDQQALDAVFARFRDTLREGTVQAAELTRREMPTPAREASSGIAFNVLSPDVVTAIQTMESRVLTRLQEDVRASFRRVLTLGFQAGEGPRAIAARLKDVVGLSATQVDAVQNFRNLLEAGDREALTRLLRDRRFDATLERLLGANGDGLSPSQIDTMSAAYERKMVSYNAMTQARTAALDAHKTGQQLSWTEAVSAGNVNGDLLRKRWVHFDPQPDPRPEHQAMDGEVVPWDQSYSNGDTYPGEQDPWNCHCISLFFLARAA